MKLVSSFLLCFSFLFWACQNEPVKEKIEKPKKVSFPSYEIDLEKKEVRMKSKVCLSGGLLEYLVCLPNSFEHEAIFVTSAKPELLHTSLLLIGRNPKQLYRLGDLWWQAIPKFPDCRINVHVEWKEKGKFKRVALNELLLRRKKVESDEEADKLAENYWVFNGSFFFEKKYIANIDKTVVAITPQSSSVVQYGVLTFDPYTGDNFGFEVNKKLCPPYGTVVDIVFSVYE